MAWADHAIERLARGEEAVVKPHGQSMTPRIDSGQPVLVKPLQAGEPRKGDVVLVRLRGNVLLHLVSAVDGDRVQISNNHGFVNGWVRRPAVLGRAEV